MPPAEQYYARTWTTLWKKFMIFLVRMPLTILCVSKIHCIPPLPPLLCFYLVGVISVYSVSTLLLIQSISQDSSWIIECYIYKIRYNRKTLHLLTTHNDAHSHYVFTTWVLANNNNLHAGPPTPYSHDPKLFLLDSSSWSGHLLVHGDHSIPSKGGSTLLMLCLFYRFRDQSWSLG